MHLFLPFERSAWTMTGQDDQVIWLTGPNGIQVQAQPDEKAIEEVPPGSPPRIHLVPVWSLCTENTLLGGVYRRSDAPLDDIQHALDQGYQRALLSAPLEAWALRQNLRPGTWYLAVEQYCWLSLDGQGSCSMPDMPDVLADLVQSACIVYRDTFSHLVLGHQGIVITVPPTRHAVLARLALLHTAIETQDPGPILIQR